MKGQGGVVRWGRKGRGGDVCITCVDCDWDVVHRPLSAFADTLLTPHFADTRMIPASPASPAPAPAHTPAHVLD
jgi:hypothetical protein